MIRRSHSEVKCLLVSIAYSPFICANSVTENSSPISGESKASLFVVEGLSAGLGSLRHCLPQALGAGPPFQLHYERQLMDRAPAHPVKSSPKCEGTLCISVARCPSTWDIWQTTACEGENLGMRGSAHA